MGYTIEFASFGNESFEVIELYFLGVVGDENLVGRGDN